MQRRLKQSTTVTVQFGPFLDETDAKTPETALTIPQSEVMLSKNAGTYAQKNSTGASAHLNHGFYSVSFDATDTNTVGHMRGQIFMAGALPVWEDFEVLSPNAYDALIGVGDIARTTDLASMADIVTAMDTTSTQLQDIRESVLIREGTAQGGALTYITLDSGASSVNDNYIDCGVVLVTGPGAGQVRTIAYYDGTSKGAGVTPDFVVAPTSATRFIIIPAAGGAAGGATAVEVRQEMDANSTQFQAIRTDIAAVEAQTDDIGTAGAGLTAIPWNTAWNSQLASPADIRTEMDTNSVDFNTLLTRLGVPVTTIAGDIAALETGGGGATAIEVRQEMDLNSTQFQAIRAKTDALPTDPADQSLLTASIDAVYTRIGANGVALSAVPFNAAWSTPIQNASAAALGAYVVPTVVDLNARTLPTGSYATVGGTDAIFNRLGVPANGTMAADLAAIEAQTDDIGANGAGLTAVPYNTAWTSPIGIGVRTEMDTNSVRLDDLTDACLIRKGTAQGGTVGTIILDAGASAVTDYYVPHTVLVLISGPGAGQARYLAAYDGATKTASITENWKTVPTSVTGYALVPEGIVAGNGGTGGATAAEVRIEMDTNSVKLQAIDGKTTNLPADPADQSLVIAATDAIYNRIGAPTAGTVSATLDIIQGHTDDIGPSGSGLTAIPFNSAWSSPMQSANAAALTAYDGPTEAQMNARTLPAASYATAADLDALETGLNSLLTYVVQHAVSTGTVVGDASNTPQTWKTDRAESETDYWRDCWVTITSGALQGQTRRVSTYVGSTKFLVFEGGYTSVPPTGTTFAFVNR
jgi:hypothetical protein